MEKAFGCWRCGGGRRVRFGEPPPPLRGARARVRLGTAPSPLRSGAMSDRSPWMNEELSIFRRSVRRFVETELAPHEPRWRADGDGLRHALDPAGLARQHPPGRAGG